MSRRDDEYRGFQEKTLDEQAADITTSLLWNDENPLFAFDNTDQVMRREFNKQLVGAGIFFSLLTTIDMRVLRRMKAA